MRSGYWDSWKGLAVVAVVLIHAMSTTGSFPISSWNNAFGLYGRQLVNFPVGLFVFLAAYFAATSTGNRGGTRDRVRHRTLRLLVPYLIWSVIHIATRPLLGAGTNLSNLPLELLTGETVRVGYFVIVMVQLAILSPFLERLSVGQILPLMFASVVISATYTYITALSGTALGTFPWNALPFWAWLPFYILGLWAAKQTEISLPAAPLSLVAVIGFICVSALEASLWSPEMRGMAVSQLKITSMLATLSVCVFATSLSKTTSIPPLSWLGVRSYYFYLSHMIALPISQKALRQIPGIYEAQPIFVLTCTIATIGFCAGGAALADFMLRNNRPALRAIGLR